MEKINLVDILKDCPSGMELDCTMWDGIIYDSINPCSKTFPIVVKRTEGNRFALTKYGQYNDADFAKCVIFPKGKTTWEGFQRPFKDGDVVATKPGGQIFVCKDKHYCYFGWDFGDNKLFKAGLWSFSRHATEEEKQELFDAIKAKGFKWNAETKTLEKLIVPKFKVGDKIRHRGNSANVFTIVYMNNDSYYCYHYGVVKCIWFCDQDDYELIPNKFDITTLNPFDKVLVRDNNAQEWFISFFSHCNGLENYKYSCINGGGCAQCIPYEGNEHLLGTTNDCGEYYKTWEE